MIVAPQHYSTLRRLHSLSGVLPLGVFLIGHMAVNATALSGAVTYDRVAETIGRLPLVRAAEVVLIGIPLVLHVVIGALIGNTEEAVPERRAHLGERTRAVQRISGGFLVAFVLFHVWSTRLSPDRAKAAGDLFGAMRHHIDDGGVLVFYALGVIATCVHFGVGLYDFAHQWGLAKTAAAARVWSRGAAVAAVAIATAGLATLGALR